MTISLFVRSIAITAVIVAVISVKNVNGAQYMIGVGRADCTGPSVEITFMGYAQLSQRGHGIHLRQFSRAFIVDDSQNRIAFVNVDAGMIGHALKREVISRLRRQYGELYSFDNVIISGTHTHGSPGGFLMHLLYDMPTMGFVQETFRAMVDGIYNSIVRAHNDMVAGRIYVTQTEIKDANINRSPTSYLNNPSEERAQYDSDVDKQLTQLQFISDKTGQIGAINWFAVHPTSCNNTNRYVTSDNVGYASLLLEQEKNPNYLPGKGPFVGAFAATNLGDVSPNIMGPKCSKTGRPCDLLTSSCPAAAGQCFASGPGRDMYDSTAIIARRIYKGASKLLQKSAAREVRGPIRFVHQFVNFPKVRTNYIDPKTRLVKEIRGCLPAMGYSFGAGTTDGPGAFDFTQGTTTDNALWNMVRDFIAEPTKDDKECHHPKPILLATGRATFPYEWQPKIVPTQLVQIGDVVIAAVPGEFTTMSGRRLRNNVRKAILQASGQEVQVILAGLSNLYSSYVATPEEYEVQRYEGASTIFGPHTLPIYVEQYSRLAQAMIKDDPVEKGPSPPFMDDHMLSLVPGVIFDGHPIGRDFGFVKTQPFSAYLPGNTVHVRFVAGNPRNNLMHDKTYFSVERITGDGNWTIVATDANWETKFRWERVSSLLGFSDIDFMWTIPESVEVGNYRVRHFGSYKFILGGIFPYDGTSRTFEIGTQ